MFDDLKIRYKSLSLAVRLCICLVAGTLPAAFMYYDQSGPIDEEYATVEAEEKSASQKLLDADKKLKNLEKTENELAFTTEQLKKAETRLPNQVAIDEILRSVGRAAKDMSVTVSQFEPSPSVVRGDEYKYAEIPIKINVEAHEYSQIASWLDQVAGLRSKLYLRSWSLRREAGREERGANFASAEIASRPLSEGERAQMDAKQSREKLRLVLAGEFSVFRLASVNDVVSDGPAGPAAGAGTSQKNVTVAPTSEKKPDINQGGG